MPDASDSCPSEYAPTADGCPAPPPPPARQRFYAYVTGVIDGDTIKLRRGFRRYTIRLIGIDTPETKQPGTPVECGGREATSRMYQLGFTRPRDTDRDGLYDRKGGEGRRVKVTTDPTQDRRDQYGRLLAYVASARGSLAAAQLRAGWATVYVFEDPFEQLTAFQAAEASARNSSRGAWGKCGADFHTPALARVAAVEASPTVLAHPQLHRGCTNHAARALLRRRRPCALPLRGALHAADDPGRREAARVAVHVLRRPSVRHLQEPRARLPLGRR